MKTELSTKVKVLVNELTAPDIKLTVVKINIWKLELVDVESELLNTMEYLTCGLVGNRVAGVHLEQIQAECTRFMDLLQNVQFAIKPLQALQVQLMTMLTRIFNQLETTYQGFFNNERYMPYCIFVERAAKVTMKMERLLQLMAENEVPAKLQDLILKSFRKATGGKRCTFHALMLTAHSMETMLNICRENEKKLIPEFLDWQLATANLCASDYTKYCTGKIMDELKLLPKGTSEGEVLDKYRQLASSLDIDHVPVCLKERQKRILKELRIFLDQQEHGIGVIRTVYVKKTIKQPITQPKAEFIDETRFKVAMSADVLAYFLRLMVKTDLILSPKAQVLRVISRSVETHGIGCDLLSPNSLSNKYDAVESSTAVKMKDVLLKMLKVIAVEGFH